MKVPTIRYYEEITLMPQAERTSGGQRRYRAHDLDRLNFIRHARDLGIGIEAIRDLLRLSENGENPCADADNIAAERLAQVRDKIANLKRLETELVRITSQCRSGHVGECYVIQTLSGNPSQAA